MPVIGIGIGVCYRGINPGGAAPEPPAWSPLELSPVLWLKSDAGLYQERTGASATTPAGADADPIGTWQDQSGNGNHLTATTDAKRPTLKLAIQNSRAVVRFDGSDDFLISAASIEAFPAKRGSLFAVYKRSAATGQGVLLGTYAGGTPPFWIWYLSTSGTLEKWYDGTAFANAALYDSFVGFVLGALLRDGDTTLKHYRGGALADSLTMTNNIHPPSVIAVGAETGGGSLHAGDIGEILVFPTALGTTDRGLVETYINSRWSVF